MNSNKIGTREWIWYGDLRANIDRGGLSRWNGNNSLNTIDYEFATIPIIYDLHP